MSRYTTIELHINGQPYYSERVALTNIDTVIMHLRALGRNKYRREDWAVYMFRPSKLNRLRRDVTLNDKKLIK